MTHNTENCIENVIENNNDISVTEKSELLNKSETQKQELQPNPDKEFNFYYLIRVEGDPEFRLSATSARKNGVKAEFLPVGWVYQNEKDAEEVAKRWTQGKRKLHVDRWFDPRLGAIWNGSKNEKRIAKKSIRIELNSHRTNKQRQKIELDCYASGLHPSWLYAASFREINDLSEAEKKIYDYFKPLWDKTSEESEENNLLCADFFREKEDVEEQKKEKLKEDNYPWNEIKIPPGFVLDNDGVWKENIKQKCDDKEGQQETIKTKICDPVWVAGRSRDYLGSESGLIIRWIDLDNIQRETCIGRRKLHTTGNSIAEELAHNNLSIVPGKEKELYKYLSAFTTNITYRSVKSLGWLENPVGDLLYISKKNTFRHQHTSLEEKIIFQPETISVGPSALECQGTLEEWKEKIAIPCKNNNVPIFLQSVAIAGTIVKFADTGSFGFHLSGLTSRGKTTAAQIAASTTGCAADPSYAPKLTIIKRWLATANALESLASQSTDSVLILDEIGQCPGSDLDKVIYNLFGGRGKERLSQQSQHKITRDWCTVVISTGERTLQDRLKETNSKTPPGLFVRFIDIHVEDAFGEDNKVFVDELKKNCGLFYGTATIAFIQKIVETFKNTQELRDGIAKGCASIAKEISVNTSLSQEHSRVLKLFCFATLAGIWASEWGIFPYTREELLISSRSLFVKWHENNKKQTEDVRCICAIRDYYLKKRDSAFRPRYLQDKDTRRFADIFGYTTTEGKFFLTHDGLNQALGGLTKKIALKALLAKEYLLREEGPSRNDSKKAIDGIDGSPRVYVISEKICEFDGETE